MIAMTSIPLADRLASAELLSRCTRRERRIVARHAEAMCVPAGTTLVRRGDPASNVFLVLEGAVTSRSAAGVRTIGAGGEIGAWELSTGSQSPATATTATVTELAVLGERAFKVLARELESIEATPPR